MQGDCGTPSREESDFDRLLHRLAVETPDHEATTGQENLHSFFVYQHTINQGE